MNLRARMLTLRSWPWPQVFSDLGSAFLTSAGPSLSSRREGGQKKLRGRNMKPVIEVYLLVTPAEKQEALKGVAVPEVPYLYSIMSLVLVESGQGKDKMWRTTKNHLTPVGPSICARIIRINKALPNNHQTDPFPMSHRNYFLQSLLSRTFSPSFSCLPGLSQIRSAGRGSS